MSAITIPITAGLNRMTPSNVTVDEGSTNEHPFVYVETNGDRGLTSAQARELAAVIIECADEIDRWAGK